MKKGLFSKIFIISIVSLALSSLLLYSSSNSIRNNSSSKSAKVQLTEQQKATLLFMYQEEKVARDVYIHMDEIYGAETNTFKKIKNSEQKHMDAVEKLCIKYGVDISEVNENDIGVFILPALQELYDALSVQDDTLEEALNVGILIEETDIEDIDNAIADMPSDASDIIRVFEHLKDGSFNHLGAFTYALSQLTS